MNYITCNITLLALMSLAVGCSSFSQRHPAPIDQLYRAQILPGVPAVRVLKLKLGRLPDEVHPRHIVGLALLGGIGFTMSTFLADLGFVDQPQQLLIAKTGVLTASLIAGTLGYLWLRLSSHARRNDR